MPVPEAAMHKYDNPPARKNDVRGAGQLIIMQAVSEPTPMQQFSNYHLRLGVAPWNTRH